MSIVKCSHGPGPRLLKSFIFLFGVASLINYKGKGGQPGWRRSVHSQGAPSLTATPALTC